MTGSFGLALPGEEEDAVLRWWGSASVAGADWAKYPLLTVGMLGLQSVWTIEMGQASPYLIELGVSKSWISLVFVLGPLSGLIMQPLIGMYTDRSQSAWGRRRPFIVIGCVIATLALISLGWCRELSAWIFTRGSESHRSFAIFIAVFSIFLIDFSVNAVTAVDRALLVDTLPSSEQEAGSAWAGRLAGLGSVIGFWVGNVNLVSALPFLGKSEMQVLTVLTVLVLISTHTIMTYTVKERILLSDSRPPASFVGTFITLFSEITNLPIPIRQICFIQFFSWIGWFPVLFFSSTWIEERYIKIAIASGEVESDALTAEGNRAGSRALMWNALVSFVTAVLLPFFVKPGTEPKLRGEAANEWWKWVTLDAVWTISNFLFAGAMFCTFFVSSVYGATFALAVCGFCWAITQWAPFSLLGEIILSSPSPLDAPSRNSFDDEEALAEAEGYELRIRTIGSASEIEFDTETNYKQYSNDTFSTPSSPTQHSLIGSSTPTSPTLPHIKAPRAKSGVIIPAMTPIPLRRTASSLSIPRSRSGTPVGGSRLARGPSRVGMDGDSDHNEDERHAHLDMPVPSRPASFDESENREERTFLKAGSDDDEDNGQSRRNCGAGRKSTAEKAGIILGIHNLAVVVPQFLVLGLCSVIFALLEPNRSVIHSVHPALKNSTTTMNSTNISVENRLMDISQRAPEGQITASPDSIGFIFRFGGLAAVVAGVLSARFTVANRNRRRMAG